MASYTGLAQVVEGKPVCAMLSALGPE